ncbi:hypothetical protein [Dictyobacter aurantiacus]|uniref:Uncharacterized protein n=1 Tax=Dictyobacter aurantiacus TaxID=1936993 RepID=A0A401ZRI1_9CHLR|nr:hypothetical protein [Dictyobacter aurantiacus]GCE09475.1 hypothetical protein KDAU_68040 [Dictyobacter aurantiacus]
MPMMVHLTSEKKVRHILQGGIKGSRGVYCMPMLQNHYISYQWLRELKRNGQRTYVAVYFRLASNEVVSVGHYSRPHEQMQLSQAIATLMQINDPQGYEIIVPRKVERKEINKVRPISQLLGWRYMPHAHGKAFCNCPACIPRGQIKSRILRERYKNGTTRSGSD